MATLMTPPTGNDERAALLLFLTTQRNALIASVHGVCLGGGLEIALHCDARTISTSVRHFGFPECFLGLVPGWPGADAYPPQPMVTQTRTVLDRYRAHGGRYREEVLAECGHSPHIEKHAEVLSLFTAFIDGH